MAISGMASGANGTLNFPNFCEVIFPSRPEHIREAVEGSLRRLGTDHGVSGYEPLRRNRRQRLDELKTGDGRPLPPHLKGQIGRELDRLELLLGQIKAVEAERDALLTPATETEGMPGPQAMLIDLRGSRVRPVIPTKAQPAAWFPGTPNMALKGGGILPGMEPLAFSSMGKRSKAANQNSRCRFFQGR